MNRLDIVYGFLIGIAAMALGVTLFLLIATPYGVSEGVSILYTRGQLGKLIALGAILDIVAFFILLRFRRDLMARGIVLAVLIITAVTFLI